MKKLLLSLVAVLATVGAWAQPQVSDAPQDGQWDANTTWFVITLKGSNSILTTTFTDSENALMIDGQTTTVPGDDALWCVVGDATNGYKFYNKAIGTSKILGITGSEDNARTKMVEDATSGYTTTFDFKSSGVAGGTFWCIKKHSTEKDYLNNRNGYLALWANNAAYGASGTGSAFLFEEAVIEELDLEFTDNTGTIHSGKGKCIKNTDGTFNSRFIIAGIPSECLKDVNIENGKYKATLNLPFPVSNAEVTNPTLIVNGASWGNPNSRKWRATTVDGTDYVKIQTAAVNQSSTDALWAIYPQLTEGKFSVKIKNLRYDKFVKADPNANGNSGNQQDVTGYTKRVSLDAEGTAFEYKVRSGKNYHFTYRNVNNVELRLSMNGSDNTDVFMGVYKGSHSGNDVAFPDYTTNMTFPISVSSSTSTNAKMISAFKEGYGDYQYGFKWYVSDNSVKMKRKHSASVTNLDDFSWAIYPMPVGENMCYAIKNIKTGKYVYTTAQFNQNGDHSGDEVELSENPMYFQLNTSNGAFYYYPSGTTTTHYLSCNTTTSANEQFLGVWTSNHNGTKNEFLPLSFEVKVSDLEYATLYSPISVKQTTYTGGDIEPSVEVYSISEEPASENVTLSSMEGGIPANQGAILKNAGTYYFTQDNNVSGDAWSDNLLQGSVTDTYVEGDAYVLSAPDGVESVGLYKALLNKDANGATGTTHFLNNAGKAYLPASAVAGEARFLVFDFGTETAIESIEGENGNVKAEIYDLAGRRVQNAQKGLYIVNGKKVIK